MTYEQPENSLVNSLFIFSFEVFKFSVYSVTPIIIKGHHSVGIPIIGDDSLSSINSSSELITNYKLIYGNLMKINCQRSLAEINRKSSQLSRSGRQKYLVLRSHILKLPSMYFVLVQLTGSYPTSEAIQLIENSVKSAESLLLWFVSRITIVQISIVTEG